MARTSRRNRQQAQNRSLTQLAGKPRSQSGGEPVPARRGRFRSAAAFSGEIRGELAKVDFPNRQQTVTATLVVLGACLVVGLFLYGCDQVFARLATRLINWQT